MDKLITNIQDELVESTKPIVVAIKSFQPIQPLQMENPQFSRFQPILIFSHSTETLRQINMFLKQVVQNATTWSRTLQELSNLRVEFEQVKNTCLKPTIAYKPII
jgi:endo-1,4-beta-mannosidase